MSRSQDEIRNSLVKKMNAERLTYTAVSEATGLSAPTISKFCSGGTLMRTSALTLESYVFPESTIDLPEEKEVVEKVSVSCSKDELYGKVFLALLKAGKTPFQEDADFLWSDLQKVRKGDTPKVRLEELSCSVILIYRVYGENDIFSNDLHFRKLQDGNLELMSVPSDLEE